jgi:hypothetical protein
LYSTFQYTTEVFYLLLNDPVYRGIVILEGFLVISRLLPRHLSARFSALTSGCSFREVYL